MTLLQGNERLLPEFPKRAARAFQQAFQGRGIVVRLNARVADSEENVLLLDDGERLAVDAALWATNASPPPVLQESGLALDPQGFLRVHDTLQAVSDPAVFGTGDCVSFARYPDLPKNGVHAVREGAVLFDNLAAFLQERPLRPFRPQRYCLSILKTADMQAVFTKGTVALKGRWARLLKKSHRPGLDGQHAHALTPMSRSTAGTT